MPVISSNKNSSPSSTSNITSITPTNSKPINTNSNSYSSSGTISMQNAMTIGIVPYTSTTNQGANLIPSITESNLPELGLVEINMIPMEIQFEPQSFILYRLTPASGSNVPPRLKLYSNINEISLAESFGNAMKSSLFEQLAASAPIENIGQLNQLGIIDSMYGSAKDMTSQKLKGFIAESADTITSIVGNLLTTVGIEKPASELVSYFGEGIKVYLGGSRILWPKLWADSASGLSYAIPVYLFCNDTGNDALYKSSITDPLTALLQYVLPRSTGGSTYQWPWFVYAEAPGLFLLPEAVVTDISVEKDDIGYNNRPATVKVTLTITTVREAMPQNGLNYSQIPAVALNLQTYLQNLSNSKANANSVNILQSGAPTDVNPNASNTMEPSSGSGNQVSFVKNMASMLTPQICQQLAANNIDPIAFITQIGYETGWGNSSVWKNYANPAGLSYPTQSPSYAAKMGANGYTPSPDSGYYLTFPSRQAGFNAMIKYMFNGNFGTNYSNSTSYYNSLFTNATHPWAQNPYQDWQSTYNTVSNIIKNNNISLCNS